MGIKCKNCGRVYWDLTDSYDPDKSPNGGMLRLRQPWLGNSWPIFGDGIMPLKDGRGLASVKSSELDCPGCLASIVYKGHLCIEPEIKIETEIELEQEIKIETEIELEPEIIETEIELEPEIKIETEIELEPEIIETKIELEPEIIETKIELEVTQIPIIKSRTKRALKDIKL